MSIVGRVCVSRKQPTWCVWCSNKSISTRQLVFQLLAKKIIEEREREQNDFTYRCRHVCFAFCAIVCVFFLINVENGMFLAFIFKINRAFQKKCNFLKTIKLSLARWYDYDSYLRRATIAILTSDCSIHCRVRHSCDHNNSNTNTRNPQINK